jgi:histidine kinase
MRTRLPVGLLRVLLQAIVVGSICACLGMLRKALPGNVGVLSGVSWHLAGTFMFLMPLARLGVNLFTTASRWAKPRLRRQLTLSYFFVITVTFLSLAGIGSITAGLVIVHNLPDPAGQARSIAELVGPESGSNAVDVTRARVLLDGVASGRLRPNSLGNSPLNLFIPWKTINSRVELVSLQGKLLAAVSAQQEANSCSLSHPNEILPGPARSRLIASAARGVVTSARVPFANTCTTNVVAEAAAAPIRGSHGQPIAVVLVRGVTLSPTWNQITGALLLGFTAASVLLVLITVLPALGISSLVAMYFASGLTRDMRAVSRAAGSLADGDLTQRAPITAKNEIGGLAEDFNRMAARMEQAVGDLRAARTQAEQALQSRQELIATVSHELRTPIAVVQAHLEVLETSGDAEASGPALQAVRGEMQRLAALVDDLFTLVRAGTEAMRVECVPTDVGSIVREVTALLGPLARREGSLTLVAEVQPGLPEALADADRLRQILANLVRNAVRHTPEGGMIALEAVEEPEWIVISVADTGEGIAPEHLPHVFERFYRVDKARTRSSGGAGLGLAIVKELLELMGGHVTVESTVGEGTCFRVYLRRG